MKTYLTKKVAVLQSINLWKWLAETGKYKSEYSWPEGIEPFADCYLCEYSSRHDKDDNDCSSCPLQQQVGHCQHDYSVRNNETSYDKWSSAPTPSLRKKYAAEFLLILLSLLDEKCRVRKVVK